MAVSCQSVEETVSGILARRPVLSPVLQAFAPLLAARAALPAQLKPLLEAAGVRLPAMQRERAAQGYPLLAEVPLAGIGTALKAAAEAMIPLLAARRSSGRTKRTAGLLRGRRAARRPRWLWLRPCSMRRPRVWKRPRRIWMFPYRCCCLRSASCWGPSCGLWWSCRRMGTERGSRNVEGTWRQGYCPVCGSGPSIAYLDRPVFDEKNAFLAGGGGKKHLHCSLCGTDWTFRRGACPFCGEEGAGVMEILKEAGNALGERLDWCTRCKTYCPTVDRERHRSRSGRSGTGDAPHGYGRGPKRVCSRSIPPSGTRFRAAVAALRPAVNTR